MAQARTGESGRLARMSKYDFLTKTATQLNSYGTNDYPLGIENGFQELTDSGWEFVAVVPPFGDNAEPVFVFQLPQKGRTGIIA